MEGYDMALEEWAILRMRISPEAVVEPLESQVVPTYVSLLLPHISILPDSEGRRYTASVCVCAPGAPWPKNLAASVISRHMIPAVVNVTGAPHFAAACPTAG